jgi:hypothetical protein
VVSEKTNLEFSMKNKFPGFLLLPAFVILLAACATRPTPTPQVNNTQSPTSTEAVVTEEATQEPTAEPTNQPTATPEPTATVEPSVEPSPTPESTNEPAGISTTDFNVYEAQAFDIQVAQPESWVVTEEPELGLIIESNEGYFETLPDANGAAILILPRDERAEEEVVEALRLSVFEIGPPPTIFIEYPTVTMVGDQDVATAPFRVDESDMEGFYVFIKNDSQGVFVFAATSGIARAEFMKVMEAVIGTVTLGEAAAP